MKRNVSGSGGTYPISEEPSAMEIRCIYRQDNRLLPKSAFGLPDAFNTLRIMKEAPVVIIVMNTNGQSPYEDIDADGRVMEICDSLWIANTCFAYEKMNHVINAMGKLNRCRCEAPQKRSRKTLEEILEYR